jgi:hypothetical protein
MYSRELKLDTLFYFYMNKSISEMEIGCPFGKVFGKYVPPMAIAELPCTELCGEFPELGSVQDGCPCETLGTLGSIIQLEHLLRKEGYLDSTGKAL